MFSLIITIISIALVAALALATLYYGGTAFNKGAAGADAARLINEGQQANGAVAIYKSDKALDSATVTRTDLAGLVTGTYLSQVPASFAPATLIVDPASKTGVSPEVCTEVNKRAGITAPPATLAAAVTGTNVFGCATEGVTGDGKLTFFYKL